MRYIMMNNIGTSIVDVNILTNYNLNCNMTYSFF